MASDTLSEIREQVYDRADISKNDPKFPPTTIDRFINAALRKASTTFDPFWLETSTTLTTVAGTYEYALSSVSSVFHKLSRIEYPDYHVTLRALGKQELTEWLSYTQQMPRFYTVEEQKIKLAPIPDRAYDLTVVFYRLEDPLVEDTDTPLLPRQYTDWLVLEAAILAATKNKDNETVLNLRTQRKETFEGIRDDIRQMRAPARVRTRTLF